MPPMQVLEYSVNTFCSYAYRVTIATLVRRSSRCCLRLLPPAYGHRSFHLIACADLLHLLSHSSWNEREYSWRTFFSFLGDISLVRAMGEH